MTYQLPERRPSALAEAHQEIVDRLREQLDTVYQGLEPMLVAVGVPRALQDAMRELDRLEGVKRDWEQAMDDCLEREAEAEREQNEAVPETIRNPIGREPRGG